jgi:hypothetical protein
MYQKKLRKSREFFEHKETKKTELVLEEHIFKPLFPSFPYVQHSVLSSASKHISHEN